MRGAEEGLVFDERSWRKCGGKFRYVLLLFVDWWLGVNWLCLLVAKRGKENSGEGVIGWIGQG